MKRFGVLYSISRSYSLLALKQRVAYKKNAYCLRDTCRETFLGGVFRKDEIHISAGPREAGGVSPRREDLPHR